MPRMSERDLIQRAERVDQRALDELCQREWRPVFGIVYQAVRDRNEAQDLTKEVFLRARFLHFTSFWSK